MNLPVGSTSHITTQEQGDVLIVRFRSRLLNDEENIEQLGQELFSLVEQFHWLKVVLDMSNVDYLTSSVIGKLITLHRKLHRCRGRLVLFGLSEGVDAILSTSRLLSYFTVADNQQTAMEQVAKTESDAGAG
jgi:anti-sigma B factor antagonist